MVSPIKARQIGFFSCLIVGIFQITITIIFFKEILPIKKGGIAQEKIYHALDILLPVFLLCTWYYGRRLGMKILIEGEAAFKTAFRTMLWLITVTMAISIALPLIYFFITNVIKNGGLPEDFAHNQGLFIFWGTIGGIVGLLLINLLPSAISGAILSRIL